MGTIAQKLTYLEDTKTAIGNAIAAKGGSVTGKTFRQYATEISNLPSGGGGTPIAESVDVSDYTGGTDFDFLKQITGVNFPSGITSISRFSFYNSGLTSVTIPNTVTQINTYAFSNCYYLTSVTLSNNLTNIDSNAFASCSSLTSITIPNSVTHIQSSAFNNCSSLTSVYISDIYSWCNIIFGNGDGNPLKRAHHLFMNNTEITNLVIPNTVTQIKSFTFIGCSGLLSVNIPSGVTTINNSAFYDCSSLTSITVEATTPPTLGNTVFDNTNSCPIYVPAASVETYKAASGWSSLSSRIQAIPAE